VKRHRHQTKLISALAIISFFITSDAFAIDWAVHGYLRNRIELYHDLDTQKPNSDVNQGGLGDNDRFGNIMFAQQRLRVDPMVKINDNLSIHSSIDVLDNIVYGTDSSRQFDFLSPIIGTIQIPGAGGAIGLTGPDDIGQFAAMNVRHAYADVLFPIGKLRIGRQPSHYGLGIFQHDGNGPEDDFGINADRILFLSSVELSQLEGNIIKREGHIINIGAAIDFAFTGAQDPRDKGIGEIIRGPSRNMWQFSAIGLYQAPKFELGLAAGARYRNGVEGDTTTTAAPILVDAAGTPITDANGNFQVGAQQPAGIDGNTLLYFADLYAKINFTNEITLEGEYAFMNGDISTGVAIDAIPFNGLPAGARGPIELPAESGMRVHLGALEVRGDHSFGEWILQGGYASGDAEPLSSRITQYGFRPDYKLALLLFNVPLGSSPRVTQGNQNGIGSRVLVGAVPVTGNFINNAIYGALGYKHKINMSTVGKFISDTKLGLKAITAWAPSDNLNMDFAEMTGFEDLPTIINSNKWYGVEIDASFETTLFESFTFSLVGGYLLSGPAYDVEVQVFNPTNLAQINTIPFDGANNVWGIQSSMRWQF
jgi:hypothetical protein